MFNISNPRRDTSNFLYCRARETVIFVTLRLIAGFVVSDCLEPLRGRSIGAASFTSYDALKWSIGIGCNYYEIFTTSKS